MNSGSNIYIPRHFKDLLDESGPALREDQLFADKDIVVLLGDSGMGKSTLLHHFADEGATRVYTVSQIINDALEKQANNTLVFIDALDELVSPSTSSVHTLDSVLGKLNTLSVKRFVLASRHSRVDIARLKSGLETFFPRSSFRVVKLEPLLSDDAKKLLNHRLSPEKSSTLVAELTKNKLSSLLSNPLTLTLLVETHDSGWPKSKTDLYEVTAQKLVREANDVHAETREASNDDLLNASKQLAAALLFSGRDSFSRIELTEFGLSEPIPTELLTSTRLISFNSGRHEFFHRSMLEYLAAKYCVESIDKKTVTVRQVRTLFESEYGGVPSVLSGAFSWLCTLLPQQDQADFLRLDPLSVLFEADLVKLSESEQYTLMDAIGDEAAISPWFDQHNPTRELWTAENWKPYLGQLASPRVVKLWRSWIASETNITSNETRAMIAIYGIGALDHTQETADELIRIVRESGLRGYVRRAAFGAIIQWVHETCTSAESLIADLASGVLHDPDGILLGDLLEGLYPTRISPKQALNTLKMMAKDFEGSFRRFWHDSIFRLSSADDLRQLAQGALSSSKELASSITKKEWEKLITRVSAEYFERCNWGGEVELAEKVLSLQPNHHGLRSPDVQQAKAVALAIQEATKNNQESLLGLLKAHINRLLNDKPELNGAVAARMLSSKLFQLTLTKVQRESALELCIRQHEGTSVSEYTMYWLTWICDSALREYGETPDFPGWVDTMLAKHEQLFQVVAQLYLIWHLPPSPQNFSGIISLTYRVEKAMAHGIRNEIHAGLDEFALGRGNLNALYNIAITYLRKEHQTDQWNYQKALSRVQELISRTDDVASPSSITIAQRCVEGLIHQLKRHDAPNLQQVLDSASKGKHYLFSWIALAAMQACFDTTGKLPEDLSQDTAEMVFVYWLGEVGAQADWIGLFTERFPDIALRMIERTTAAERANPTAFHGRITALTQFDTLRKQSFELVMELLSSFPARANIALHSELRGLMELAQEQSRDEPQLGQLLSLIEKKLNQKSLVVELRALWLWYGLALAPQAHMPKLESFLKGKEAKDRTVRLLGLWRSYSWEAQRIRHWPMESLELFVQLVGTYLTEHDSYELFTLDYFIDLLQSKGSREAKEAFGRLLRLALPTRNRIQLRAQRLDTYLRDTESSQRKPSDVLRLLNNGKPKTATDLRAWLTDTLRARAYKDRNDSGFGFHRYWNKENGKLTAPRYENDCRNQLLELLRLEANGIAQLEPEGSYKEDTRADIKAFLDNGIHVPVEIKQSLHRDVWTACRYQLIEKYSVASGANGQGIYLVLWFGNRPDDRKPEDKGGPIQDAASFEKRLRGQLSAEEQRRIEVIVMDCSPIMKPERKIGVKSSKPIIAD